MSDLATRLAQLQQGAPAELKPAEALALAREIRRAGESCGLRPLRAALLASFSLQFSEPYLVVEAARRGLLLETYFGPFGQLEQELAADTGLRRFAPQVLVLAMRPEDVDPDAVVRYHASGGRRFAELAEALIGRLGGCVELLRAHSAAPVLIANFAAPPELPLGVFDANLADSATHAFAQANRRLAAALGAHADAFVWDYAGLVRSQGAASWTDRRLLALARDPIAARQQPALARHLLRTLHALLRPPAKCLVLDLDNTLWGGVVGDDGLEGLALGDDHPGVVYKAFQRAVLALRDRGILLAVASKNDPDTAQEVFRKHPEMLIRWEDLAAARIGWGPKSESLREIAAELNLGADALVFFDDNPVERAEVRANAPEVRVVEVPADPLRLERALAECGEFDSVTLTEEDAARAELYRQEGARRQLQQGARSLEEFLEGLEMRASVGRLGLSTLQRVAQLVAKTNQFNLTTRRHGRAELEAMGEDRGHVVAWLRLRDRYGDAGLVAVGILRREGEAAVIDSLLMSCRVMGRAVERALLAHLAEQARALGCRRLLGDYLPTRKNAVVASLYAELGFELRDALPGGGRRYVLDLERETIAWPEHIGREAQAADGASA
jgi:FkbH-like protein